MRRAGSQGKLTNCVRFPREDVLCISFMGRVCLLQTQTSVCPSCEFSGSPSTEVKTAQTAVCLLDSPFALRRLLLLIRSTD